MKSAPGQMSLFNFGPEKPAEEDTHHPDGRRKTKALARKSDPSTSHEAAAKVDVGRHESIVMTWLKKLYAETKEPCTTWELAVAADPAITGNPRMAIEQVNTIIHKRMAGLERKGKIVRCKPRADRLKGSKMTTWRPA